MNEVVERWRDVEPLHPVNGDTKNLLATVDTVRGAWDEYLSRVSPEEFDEARRRTLTRHAIETGIIERLYEVSWGVTEALVAEGLTLEAAARAGGIAEETLDVIHSQLDALQLLVAAVKSGRELTSSFIKELHSAITRTQLTYKARDQFGRYFDRPLKHGEWKEFPNDVTRVDGSRLEYAPPEQVQSQIDTLLQLYEAARAEHPIILASWLHHRFVRIHPFQDGNGRVARALSLMVLLRAKYAPIVVTNDQREDYIDALDAANQGDIRPLVRLFAGLELVALKSEISVPVSRGSAASGAVPVARELVSRLNDRRASDQVQRALITEKLASDVQARIIDELARLASDLKLEFRAVDPLADSWEAHAAPGDPNASYWYRQIVFAANRVDFFADLHSGSWWTSLSIRALGHLLRYLVVVQKVGRGDVGVLAVTAVAEVVNNRPPDDADEKGEGSQEPRWAFEPTAKDSVTLVYSNDAGDRWQEIADLIDRTLATSLRFYVDQLS